MRNQDTFLPNPNRRVGLYVPMEKPTVLALVVAGVVIKKDGKYLLVQEKKPQVYGQWNLPAGRVDVGDSLEKTAIKEAKEESGYDVKILRKLGIYQNEATEAVKHAYQAEIVGGELAFPPDEIMDARWMTFDEVVALKDTLRGSWVLEAITMVEEG